MKRILAFGIAILISAVMFAQPPNKMSYQAVVRNSNGQLITNQNIGLQISILHGTINGQAIYVEQHFPTTNENGLVTIEIGSGTIVTGSLSSIDWANGTYFINTEIDLDGGANYSISGTSQLLSVPYAFHAKTVESINETDPVFSAWDKSTGISITENQINDLHNYLTTEVDGSFTNELQILSISNDTIYLSNGGFVKLPAEFSGSFNDLLNVPVNLDTDATDDFDGQYSSLIDAPTNLSTFTNDAGYLTTESDPLFTEWDKDYNDLINQPALWDSSYASIKNKPDLTIYATKNMADGNITELADPVNDQDAATKLYVDYHVSKKYSIGDFAYGGIVFWIDETGQHGLVCAKTDQSIGVRWYAGTFGHTRAYGDGPFAGKMNTAIIIAAHVAIGDDGSTYAARICNELQIIENDITYGDWYLPSKAELNLMHQNRMKIDSTAIAHDGNAFANDTYWSSTEEGYDMAYPRAFWHNERYEEMKTYHNRVRAIRAF